MKPWSVIGLLFTAASLATIPISPQVTPRGVELSVNQAQAITYGRARRVSRRVSRRDYYGSYGAPGYNGAPGFYGAPAYGTPYGGYQQQPIGGGGGQWYPPPNSMR